MPPWIDMKPDDLLKLLIALGVLAIVVTIVLLTALVPIPKDQMQLFTTLAVALAGSLGTVVGFLFGSSLGSRAKDATIANRPNP